MSELFTIRKKQDMSIQTLFELDSILNITSLAASITFLDENTRFRLKNSSTFEKYSSSVKYDQSNEF